MGHAKFSSTPFRISVGPEAVRIAQETADAAAATSQLVIGQAIAALMTEHKSVREIAAHLSLSKSEVSRRARAHNAEYRTVSPSTAAAAEDIWDACRSDEERAMRELTRWKEEEDQLVRSQQRDAELVAIAQELFGHGTSVALRREEGLLTEITVMWLGDRLDNDSIMVGILNEFQSELPGRAWERSSDVLRRSAHFVRRSRPLP